MATTAQIQQFVSTWQSAAVAASKVLNIPPSIILAQWGNETGFGTQGKKIGQNNPGNILDKNMNPINFSSQQSFLNEYTASMKADFPYFKKPTPLIGDQANSMGLWSQLVFGAGGTYLGKNDPNYGHYGKNIYGALKSILNATNQSEGTINDYLQGKATPIIGVSAPGDNTGTTTSVSDALTGIPSAIANATQAITTALNYAGIAILGLLLGIAGIWLLTNEQTQEGET